MKVCIQSIPVQPQMRLKLRIYYLIKLIINDILQIVIIYIYNREQILDDTKDK
jgi:hypothetical protein